MAIKSRDELMNAIKNRLGDGTDDESIALIEDVTDTLNDYESKVAGDGTDWKTKYEENDASWRKKYHDRFFNSSSNENDPDPFEEEPDDNKPKMLTYDDLFTVEKR